MLIVIIAMTVVSLPVVVSIFFIFYKSYIFFAEKYARPAIETPIENLSFSNRRATASDDEIAAVISAAVSVYLQKK